MGEAIVELAKELTLALIRRGDVSPEDLQGTLQKTYTTLSALKVQEESETSTRNTAKTILRMQKGVIMGQKYSLHQEIPMRTPKPL
jgi:hypothetical protein